MKTAQCTLLAATLLTIFSTSVMAQDVTIIYTNDLHAHVDSYKVPYVADGKRDIGGFANISTLVKQEKAKNKATFYFDAGDYFTGPYISSLTKGEAIIDIMNTMPFDAVSIGNHEFDHGWDNALRQLSKANFPVLLGNVYHKESEKPFWNKPYTSWKKMASGLVLLGYTAYLHLMTRSRSSLSRDSIMTIITDLINLPRPSRIRGLKHVMK